MPDTQSKPKLILSILLKLILTQVVAFLISIGVFYYYVGHDYTARQLITLGVAAPVWVMNILRISSLVLGISVVLIAVGSIWRKVRFLWIVGAVFVVAVLVLHGLGV